ncbi:hypothetical protein CJD36_000540 [Flavipsychrobacter stenotrophus]|uniref:Putative beta-lactamase-inhibitor-like PepSY-like domain-containing protein n=1 Tax=Flavipsychrobacter stenotrophus TaxID=2077091 RepID=A0A2S7SZA1_9BACT|nr:PepSY-like domain-containing protein [Flavipsychrobacter stenotrophus]PQJ12280.1 hypothetical protein CJD36_000540 [Flavipsychrobacter stenotrophus]
MKHIVLCVAMLCTISAIAQKTTSVPALVKAAFAKAYTTATKVKWEKEHGNYEVSFTNGADKMSVVYNEKGVAEETETAIPADKLPASAKKYAEAKGKIKDAAIIVKADGSKVYEAEVNGKDLIFDMQGNFIKEVKD